MASISRLVLVLAVLGAGRAGAQEPRDYYLYQRAALPSALHVDVETATGTRDAGAFGRRGLEGLVRTGLTLAEHWTFEGTVGVAEDRDTDERGVGFSAEARYGWSPEGSGWGLGAGGGYRRDYTGVSIPYVRMIGERALARWNIAVSGLVEFPVNEADEEEEEEAAEGEGQRDAADLILSLGTSYAVSSALRLGVELAAEDLEGFVDDEEAEGGAKFILGPTLNYRFGADRIVRGHVGWIYAATANEPTNPGAADYRGNRHGVLARVSLGFGR